MLPFYVPTPGTTSLRLITSNGDSGVSDNAMALNILIELRVLTELLYAQQSGVVFDSLDSLRNDVVNATSNPPT
jgi:hypothetical protein